VLYLGSPEFSARKAQLSGAATRGLLVPAGGRSQMAGAYLLLRFIREALNSSMPAEVVYNGPRELDDKVRGLLLSLPHVALVDGSAVALPPHHGTSQEQALKHGWSFKVWALCYATSFRQVLMIDADNTLLVPPEQLFDTREWREHANVFWPDFMRGGEGIIW
jgi:alpha 1,2-mannosyltransferase